MQLFNLYIQFDACINIKWQKDIVDIIVNLKVPFDTAYIFVAVSEV